jgi:di/tricarboxylate transporter
VTDAGLSAAILLLALVLFVTDRMRHDLVALTALFACLFTGLVTPSDALLGFADPAVIAVAAVLIVGRAIELSGVAGFITRILIPAQAAFPVQLAILMTAAATLSAFMNNIAALVIAMPLGVEMARRAGLSAGAVLMPLAFATILGGMTTLIGTPANLILSSVREEQLGEAFGFFSMTPVGTTVAMVGLLYLALVGWRLIPIRRAQRGTARPWRVFELRWNARGNREQLLSTLRAAGARMLAAFHDGQRLPSLADLQPGDRLLLVSRNDQWDILERTGLDPGAERPADAVTARVVVAHGSFLIGQGYEAVRTRSGGQLIVVAGGPRPARLRQPLDTIRIEAGDQLYISGPVQALAALVARGRLLEVDRFDATPIYVRRALGVMAVFLTAVATVVLDIAPPAIAFLGAAVLVAAFQLIPPEEIYRSIDWPIILLLAAMIPVGSAFESTGAAAIVAASLAQLLVNAPVLIVLAALCAGTLLLSVFLNNVATAIIMGPIAIELSRALDVSPDAALLAVLVGASSDFITPIGHQNNLLVMGPGGYRFGDYARVGTILSVLTVATTALVLSRVA